MKLNGDGLNRSKFKLWYKQPAEQWLEALPIGNGRLGGMVFGGINEELIQLNEDTLWAGYKKDTNNHSAPGYLEEVRKLLSAGEYAKAQEIIETSMLGPFTQPYQPLGNLHIKFENQYHVEDYQRILDLNEGTARVKYKCDDSYYTRDVFSSAVDQIIVIHIACDNPGKISFNLTLDSLLKSETNAADDNCLALIGRCPSNVHIGDVYTFDNDNIITYDDESGKCLDFVCQIKVMAMGGAVTSYKDTIHVKGVDEVTILVSAATSFNGGNPQSVCQRFISDVEKKPYKNIYYEHVADFKELFERMDLQLGQSDSDELPTDVRLDLMRKGVQDPGLIALLFQFGRYLLISSSRQGSQPANLQGIWNDKMVPPWWSNWTMNINVEMNYWPAEICNLPECHIPLFDFIERLCKNGRETARVHYGCRGWIAHHMTDLWCATSPVGYTNKPVKDSASWGMWTMSAA